MRSLIFLLLCSSQAFGALYDRGDGLIYDDVLDITWLQDANYAQTSGFDIDGRMTWSQSIAWVDNLIYSDHSNWRLPSRGPFCHRWNCNQSEIGNLFYSTLGNSSISAPNIGPFNNIQPSLYWTDTPANNNGVWGFIWSSGYQQTTTNYSHSFTWPVHDGDIGLVSIPLPASITLFLSGLVGLGLTRSIGINK